MEEKKLTFEEAYKNLEQAVEKLDSDGVTLDEALENYEKGVRYYKECLSLLDNARQRIEQFKKEEADEQSGL